VNPETELKIKNYLSAFSFELTRRNKSGRTVENYSGNLMQLFRFADETRQEISEERAKFLTLTVSWVTRLQWRFRKGELAATTINLHIEAIRSFASLVLRHILTDRELPRMKEPHKIVEPFSRDEVQRIFAKENNRKHLLVLQCAYYGGLRLGDIRYLKIRNLLYEKGVIHIENGKGAKDRYTFFPDELQASMKVFTIGKNENDFVFSPVGSSGQYPERTIGKICENACIRAGIAGRHNIHRLRHSFATHLIQKKVPIKYVQEAMGHSSVKTTERYIVVAASDISQNRNALAMDNKAS
jgi:integrase/recombinase XerD